MRTIFMYLLTKVDGQCYFSVPWCRRVLSPFEAKACVDRNCAMESCNIGCPLGIGKDGNNVKDSEGESDERQN